MSTTTHAVGDTATMLRRKLKHMLRYPSMTLILIGLPVVFLLLFVYVFGGTLGDGLGGPSGGRDAYVNYVTPGIILLAVVGSATATAVSVATDMNEGIIARFRTMSIFRPSMLTGHVVGSAIQTLLGMAVVIGIALLVGFRPTAGLPEWLAIAGLLTLLVLAVTWLSVGLGLAAQNVESASNLPMPLLLLPFLGSGFVPTDSMPAWLEWFAEHQPFTPVIETLRGLFFDMPIGNNAWISVVWCVGITAVCFLWARRLFNRDPSR
ncbi:ABC transporter permease [Phytoactinopolyspora mesophila]|uniref:Transport permease protein n=1 Tax=Phytoactinopolyspora mesophila TaxID=2650750 RepID=A0A7K3MAD0_9ACTN|nr:ABC transporter permease [Phytoactinopolyspora mesophila]NDL60259.1 ABC transporter permease [Phytoactinopolyspora mesophila]